jgi:HAD superfamily hydrolase (TIGR01509 family)
MQREKLKIEEFLMPYQVYIFDLDGTLIDLEDLNFSAYAKALKERIELDLSMEDYQKFFAGTKTAEAFDNYLKSQNTESSVDDLIAYFRSIKESFLLNEIKLHSKEIDGAIKFLKVAKDQGKRLCLATSTIKKFTDIILNEYDIADLFEIVITAEDVEKGKPDPEIYQLALEKMQVTATDAVVFEDSSSGILAAKAASIKVVGVQTKGRNDEEVKSADFIINSYRN